MNRRGMTLIELVIVIGLVGVLAAFGFPRLADSMTKQNVISARAAVVSLHAKTRATAISRGARAIMVFNGNVVRLYSRHPVTGATVQLGPAEDLNARYGVTVTTSQDTLGFDARGLGIGSGDARIAVTRGAHSRGIVINALGRVIQ